MSSGIFNIIGYKPAGATDGIHFWYESIPSRKLIDAALILDWQDGADDLFLSLWQTQDVRATALRALLSSEQIQALGDYYTARITEKRLEKYQATNGEFLDLAYDLLSSGKTLNATNMKPWMDKVAAVKAELPKEAQHALR